MRSNDAVRLIVEPKRIYGDKAVVAMVWTSDYPYVLYAAAAASA